MKANMFFSVEKVTNNFKGDSTIRARGVERHLTITSEGN